MRSPPGAENQQAAQSVDTLLVGVDAGRASVHSRRVHLALVLCFSVIPTVLLAFLIFLIFFERGLTYRVESTASPLASAEFLRILTSIADAELHRGSAALPLVDGEAFYAAQLDAIRSARESVHLEQYIFETGTIGSRFVEALV